MQKSMTRVMFPYAVPLLGMVLGAVIAQFHIGGVFLILGSLLYGGSTGGAYWLRRLKHAELPRLPILEWLPLLGVLSILGAFGFVPPDDLTRHMASHLHDYDYSQLYADGAVKATWSMWIGFEMVVGAVHELLGSYWALQVVIMTSVVVAYVSVWAMLRGTLQNHPNRQLLVFTLLLLTMASGVLWRGLLGRPEVFILAAGLFASVMRPAWWVALMLLVSPMYWLSAVYAPFALLLNTTLKARLISGSVVLLGSLAFWMTYSGGDWFNFAQQIQSLGSDTLLKPTETQPLSFNRFLAPTPLLLLISAVFLIFRRNPRAAGSPLIVAGWFALSNMARYAPTIVPMLTLVVARLMPVRLSYRLQFFILLAAFYGSYSFGLQGWQMIDRSLPAALLNVVLPADAKVVSTTPYIIPLSAPLVVLATPMEARLASRETRENVMMLAKNQVPCDWLRREGYTHLIEHMLKDSPTCGVAEYMYGEGRQLHRQWRITAEDHPSFSLRPVKAPPAEVSETVSGDASPATTTLH